MSFIGSLDQFDLSIILQRIESYKKSGLLVVKQGERVVELSFQQGHLLCIGPVRPEISLADRLLQAGVISREAYQELALTPGADIYREVGAALALIDLGHVNQQSLYGWAFNEATRVIETLIAWTDGEIYFEEGQQPPSDRLLIALAISSLLPEQPPPSLAQPVAISEAPSTASAASVTPSNISDALTMHGEMPTFFDDITAVSSFLAQPGTVPDMEHHTDPLPRSTMGTLLPPQPVSAPLMPTRVDMSYMQPNMVITPVDLSAYREQNPQIPFTPDQWRLFTRADGQTTLQVAAQQLSMSPEQVCQVAGELVALGVIALSQPVYGQGDGNEPSSLVREHIQVTPSNGMLAPAYALAQPSPNPLGRPSQPYPIETYSQWGNGGNGAIFVLGNGWVVAPGSPQPSQPLPMSQYDAHSRVYAKAG